MKLKILLSGYVFACFSFQLATDTHAQRAAAGAQHTVFLCQDSIPSIWGNNVSGQLGNSTSSYRTIPAKHATLRGITAVSAASNFSLFLKEDGKVYATGDNQKGQLGDGTTTGRKIPAEVPGLTGVTAISAGAAHSLFLKNDGTVWACGDNTNGQLGDGTTESRSTPVQVSSLTGIIAISAGSAHSLFLKNDSTVYACGLNLFGLLGTGKESSVAENTPHLFPTLAGIVKINAGQNYSLFVKGDGTAWAVGDNDYGQLGDGTSADKYAPVQVTTLSGITDAEASHSSTSFFIKNDGTIWAAGYNGTGMFGTGVNSGFDPNPTPVQLNNLSNITAVAAGLYHAVFINAIGTAKASGGNAQGQLGNATTTNSTSLVTVSDLCPATVGLREVFSGNSIYVFPNPAGNYLNITSDKPFSEVRITNMLGETVYSSRSSGRSLQVDLTGHAAGVYLVQIQQAGSLSTSKVIVK